MPSLLAAVLIHAGRRVWRAMAAALLLFLWGCASAPPAPPPSPVTLRTTTATQYYAVHGKTADEIFDHIDRHRLFEKSGERAIGLTSAEWMLQWQGSDRGGMVCDPPPMSITVVLLVTLPQHVALSDAAETVRTRWEAFAATIAAHEQRHVDLFLEGAQSMKSRMEAALARPIPCAEMEKIVRSVWATQQAEIGAAQDHFHAADKARIERDRKPLQAQIDANQARLTTMDAEIKRLDASRDDLRRQIDVTRARVEAARALPAVYNRLIADYNVLIERHNGAGQRRHRLVDEYNALVRTTNNLIDVLNWTR
jgi:predicted secreted Zn-dependent protease